MLMGEKKKRSQKLAVCRVLEDKQNDEFLKAKEEACEGRRKQSTPGAREERQGLKRPLRARVSVSQG